MDKNLINSHDRFFKQLFSKKAEISEFVAKTFPQEIVSKLHLDTLEIDKTDYIDQKLRASYSDLVYNCKYGDNTDLKISLLFDHKSYPESFPHFQLLGYMLKIWETQIKQKQDLTPVIPIIFYHGKQKWKIKPFKEYFSELDDNLQKFIPKFDYQLIDTSDFTDKQITELFESLQLQIGILLMKNIYNEQKILQEINTIFAGINQLLQTEQGEQFFETIVSYLFYATKIETQKFVEKMRTISPKAEEKFISTAMRLQMKGKMEGIKKVAYKLIQKGLDNQFIKETTNLTDEQIDYLRKMKEYQLELETI